MTDIEVLNSSRGLFPSQLRFFKDGSLILSLKDNLIKEMADIKIQLNGILVFHDTGIIGKRITFCDSGSPGYIYSEYAILNKLKPFDFKKYVFFVDDGKQYELIVVCKSIEIVRVQHAILN
jgi:hypothetical protein